MKKNKPYGFVLLILISVSRLLGQDIHFSQFMHNPIHQNPAHTGLHGGDYRFNAAFRDQWRSVTLPYNTFLFSADAANLYKNISFGGVFMHDVAGDGRFRTVDFTPSIALGIPIGRAGTHSLRPGIQFGLNYRELRSDQFTWDSQFGGHIFDPSLPSNETFQRENMLNFTVNSGLIYQWFDNDRKNVSLGFSAFNMNRQNQGFFGEVVSRPIRLMVHGRAQFQVSELMDILPAFSLNKQAQYTEFLIGSELRYVFKQARGEYIAFYVGAFTRTGDAAFINLGMDYQNWWFGVSYDWNYSNLVPASRYRGGIELTTQYIFKSFKPRKNIIHRTCPVYL
jgi:type IX secretion system PorP/SprF family membrane protein